MWVPIKMAWLFSLALVSAAIILIAPPAFTKPSSIIQGLETYKTRGQLNEEIRNDLKIGRLHPDLLESLRIVPPNSPETQKFQPLMTDLFKRLFPYHDFARYPVQFLLVHDEAPNAFRLLYSTHPVFFGFTTGFLLKIKNLDQLAACLRHEAEHFEIETKRGDGPNSKGEEVWADVSTVRGLLDAGLDPLQAKTLFEDVLYSENDRKNIFEQFSQILDVHPSGPVRVRAIELALAETHQERGPFKRTPTPLPTEFREIAKNAKHEAFLDQFLRRENILDNSGVAERMDALAKYVSTTFNWSEVRQEDFKRELSALLTDGERKTLTKNQMPWKDKKTRTAFDRLVRAIQSISKKNTKSEEDSGHDLNFIANAFYLRLVVDKLYVSGFSNAQDRRERPTDARVAPLGVFQDLNQRIESFLKCKEFGECVETSKKFLESFELLRENYGDIFSKINWSRFKMPSIHPGMQADELPWNDHVHFAAQDETRSIHRALYILGVRDRRLVGGNDERTFDLLLSNDPQIAAKPAIVGQDRREVVSDITDLEFQGNRVFLKKTDEHYGPSSDPGLVDPRPYLLKLLAAASKGDKAAEKKLEDLITNKEFLSISDTHHFENIFGTAYFGWNPELLCKINAAILSHSSAYNSTKQLADIFKELLTSDFEKYRPFVRKFYLEKLGKLKFWRPDQADWEKYREDFYNGDLFQFAILDPFKLFSDQEKLEFLNKRFPSNDYIEKNFGATYFKRARKHNSYYWLHEGGVVDELRRLLGYEMPETWEEVYALQAKMRAFPYSFGRNIAVNEANGFLVAQGPAGLDLNRLMRDMKIKNEELIDDHTEELSTKLHEAIQQIVDVDHLRNPDIRESVSTWLKLSEFHALPNDGRKRNEILKYLLSGVEALPSSSDRMEQTEKLLIHAGIEDPEIRKRAIEVWTESIRAEWGRDDGTEEYFTRITPILERISMKASPGTRFEMFKELSDTILSQEKLSFDIEKRVFDISRRQLAKSQIPGLLADLLVHGLARDYDLADQLAIYLTELSSEASLKLLMQAVYSNGHFHYIQEFSSQDLGELLRDQLRVFHGNYWSQPLGVRTVIADYILLPPRNLNSKEKEIEFKRRFDFVLDKILPKNAKYHQKTKVLLNSYFDVLEEYQRGPYLAAIMAATRRIEEENREPSPGEFLGVVLDQLGPAEKKIAQAIHSHPDTPDELREGMKKSKVMTEPMYRWDVWKRIRNLPEEYRSQIGMVNETEGAASLRVVMNITLKSDSTLSKLNGSNEAALSLLRSYADEKMADGFSKAERFVQNIPSNHSISALKAIIREAHRLAKIETDPQFTERQYQKAAELYDGVNLEFNEQKYRIEFVRLLGDAHGRDFAFTSLAKGVHFNSLDPANESTRQFAVVDVFVELSLLLSGMESDEDPHGGNERVDIANRRLIRMDPGGIALQPPTEAELSLLGGLFVEAAIESGADEKSFREKLSAKLIKAQEQNPGEQAYLIRVQKMLLALQDKWRYLNQNDLKIILSSIYRAGILHPEIIRAGIAKADGLTGIGEILKIFGASEARCAEKIKLLPRSVRNISSK